MDEYLCHNGLSAVAVLANTLALGATPTLGVGPRMRVTVVTELPGGTVLLQIGDWCVPSTKGERK